MDACATEAFLRAKGGQRLETTNIAVIGVGYWGKKVAFEYERLGKESQEVRLAGACDVLEQNLKYCKDNYGLLEATNEVEDILCDPEIDAVHVCTPSETHYKIAKSALEAGKHVLVEKPLTLNFDEARELVDLAHSRNLILSVGHIFRFDAALAKVKDLLMNGYFGELFWLKFQWTAFMPLMEGRDIITDLAPHPFDILNFITGQWPLRITCVAKSHRKGQAEEDAQIVAELRNNVTANMELSWLHPEKIRQVSIMGSERFVRVDCLSQTIQGFKGGIFYKIPVERSNTIKSELFHFVESIRNANSSGPDRFNINNGGIGAKVVRLLEITRQAMINGRTESVEL